MKIVREYINEAIKHLPPKSEKEISHIYAGRDKAKIHDFLIAFFDNIDVGTRLDIEDLVGEMEEHEEKKLYDIANNPKYKIKIEPLLADDYRMYDLSNGDKVYDKYGYKLINKNTKLGWEHLMTLHTLDYRNARDVFIIILIKEETTPENENLLKAVRDGSTQLVKKALDKGADVHIKNDEPLRLASSNGKTEIVKLLLDAGANVHALNDNSLLTASHNGHVEVVKLLLAAGATKKDAALKLVCTTLEGEVTEKADHLEIIEILVKAGADIFAGNNALLVMASKIGLDEMVQTLIHAGANVHAQSDKALHNACYKGHEKIVKLLLKAGADIHSNSDLALRLASDGGHEKIVKLLLEAGADVHAVRDWALLFAIKGGHIKIVKILLDAGASIHAADKEDLQWVMQHARRKGYTDIIEILKKERKK